MKQLLALAALPMIAAPAMAAPYIESKTNVGFNGASYVGTTTSLRGGYTQPIGGGVTLYGEVGPGYLFPDTGNGQTTVAGEVGVQAPLAEKLALKVKYEGAYLTNSSVWNSGAEVKVRYTF